MQKNYFVLQSTTETGYVKYVNRSSSDKTKQRSYSLKQYDDTSKEMFQRTRGG